MEEAVARKVERFPERDALVFRDACLYDGLVRDLALLVGYIADLLANAKPCVFWHDVAYPACEVALTLCELSLRAAHHAASSKLAAIRPTSVRIAGGVTAFPYWAIRSRLLPVTM